MNIIYPVGSIITMKKDQKKYCITKICEDYYEAYFYPFGKIEKSDKVIIPFSEVDKIFFFGKLFDDQKELMEKRMFDKIRKKVEKNVGL